MILFFIVVTLAVIAVVAGVASGWIGGGLEAPTSSVPTSGLPDGPVAVHALEHVRFAQALRGYRMDQVDAVLDRMSEVLRLRDEEIARLESALAHGDRISEEQPDTEFEVQLNPEAEPMVAEHAVAEPALAEPAVAEPALAEPVSGSTHEETTDVGGRQEPV